MYIKNLKKKYQEKWENAYLIVKNARASRALRMALEYWPILARFARPPPLRYVGKSLDPLVQLFWEFLV